MDKNNLDWDEQYYWKVRFISEDENMGEWSPVFTFIISDNSETFTNDNDPIMVTNHNPELTSNGVVFFGSYINQYSAAIDVDGNEQKVIDGFGEILHDKRLKSIMVEINLTQENNFIDRIQSNGFKKIENKEYVIQDYLQTGMLNCFFVREM